MEDLCLSDEVFGMDGKIYRIVGTSDVMHGHRVFDVVFDDGTVIRADADHCWHTFTYAERAAIHRHSTEYRANRRAKRSSRGKGKRPDLILRNQKNAIGYEPEAVTGGVRTTLEIKETLIVRTPVHTNHAIPVSAPLELPERYLLIHPYMLGYWLGDGTSSAGSVCIGDQDRQNAVELIHACGYTTRKHRSGKHRSSGYQHGVLGLQAQLRQLNLLKNKHIPEDYLFASFEQRVSLLKGLMDTDGTAAQSGQCEFYNTNQRLIQDVSRLLHTLGIKHAIREKKPPKNTKYGVSYRIKFVAPFRVFALDRKAQRQNTELRDTQKWRYIVDVREVDSEPVKCIAIDSPDHLYLAGEACVPTHNSDLLLGLTFTQHWRSAIYRRHYKDLSDVILRGDEILNGAASYVSGDKQRWTLPDGRMVILSSVQHRTDLIKYQGKPRDFIGIDEAAEFPEDWFRYLTGWLRTSKPGQRTRIVLTFNPPQTPEGEWIIRYFAPWLDPDYAGETARPGELRYFIRLNDTDTEVDGAEPVMIDGLEYKPQSRTFIPARVDDNPHLTSDYKSQLNMLFEPLRSQLLFGDFTIKPKDNIWQVIPTAHVLAAQKRWRERERPNVALRSMSSDPARGGDDKHAIAKLYGTFFELYGYPGVETPDGIVGAKQITDLLGQERAPIYVDVIGIGASVYDQLNADTELEVYPVNNAGSADGTDKTGKYEFSNIRAASYWRLREALDPASGEDICLPDIRELRADLCAPRYSVVGGRIKVEPKDEIKKRIGRSPDDGDAIVMAWYGTQTPQVTIDFDLSNWRGL